MSMDSVYNMNIIYTFRYVIFCPVIYLKTFGTVVFTKEIACNRMKSLLSNGYKRRSSFCNMGKYFDVKNPKLCKFYQNSHELIIYP